jgi:hypothetical protein
MAMTSTERADTADKGVIPNPRELASEIREAFTLFHAAWWDITSIDSMTIDLCRLKSAHLNDCKW